MCDTVKTVATYPVLLAQDRRQCVALRRHRHAAVETGVEYRKLRYRRAEQVTRGANQRERRGLVQRRQRRQRFDFTFNGSIYAAGPGQPRAAMHDPVHDHRRCRRAQLMQLTGKIRAGRRRHSVVVPRGQLFERGGTEGRKPHRTAASIECASQYL